MTLFSPQRTAPTEPSTSTAPATAPPTPPVPRQHRLLHRNADSAVGGAEIREAATRDAAAPAVRAVQALPQQERVRVGPISLLSAAAYLGIWSLVLFVVWMGVATLGYLALEQLGVLRSLSRAAATVLSQRIPARDGVLPVLRAHALMPYTVLSGMVLAVLWWFTTVMLVAVHNCICLITGGPRLRIRRPHSRN